MDLLARYSATALHWVWNAVRFSWWFTTRMHKLSADPLDHRLQVAELDYRANSAAARTEHPQQSSNFLLPVLDERGNPVR